MVCTATALLLPESCTVCRRGHQDNRPSHKELSLVFFSTFEPINLSPDYVMQGEKELPMLYELSERQLPTLYVCPAENMLGRVPLIPCYLAGNTHPTIPYGMRGGNLGETDSRADSGTGSKLFEVNLWLWKYDRSLPLKCTVGEVEETRRKRLVESRKRGAATAKRRREAREGAGA